MNRALLIVPSEILLDVLTGATRDGLISIPEYFDIPIDAKVISIQSDFRYGNAVILVLESVSFPSTKPGKMVPIIALNAIARRIHSASLKTAEGISETFQIEYNRGYNAGYAKAENEQSKEVS